MSSPTSVADHTIHTLEIRRDVEIAAPLDITFEAVLAELGPESQMPGGKPMPMKIEPWPGGRWYRDLGDSAGHFWGHVQVIKPPTLLEICGPMFMSYPAVSHIQYRLSPANHGTRLEFMHRAFGFIPAEHRQNVSQGWEYGLQRIREIAEELRTKRS